jgi:hypothetical protein
MSETNEAAVQALDAVVAEAKAIEAGAEMVKSAIKPKKKGGSAKVEALRKEKKVKGKLSTRKEAKLKKVNKQTAKRVKKFKAKNAKPKSHGPAYEKWKKRFRPERKVGQCFIKNCTTKPAGAKFCQTHKKEYRKDQLALNNVTWRKRIDEGKALHHVIYNGELTEWAKKNLVAAKRIVSGGKSIADMETFNKAVAKFKTTEAKEKAAGKSKKAA